MIKITRRRILFVLMACCALAVAALWTWGRREDEELERLLTGAGNYSLIEDNLYMGGLVPEPPPGTKAVLNVCEHKDVYGCDILLWKRIRDAAPAPSLIELRKMVEFVDEQQRAGRQTYVHCFQGASRSGLVVVAYVMYKKHWTRDKALGFVRSQRAETRPNPAFMQLLLEWERVILAESALG